MVVVKFQRLFFVITIGLTIVTGFNHIQAQKTPASYGSTTQQKTDYVPDKETAIKIAEAIWFPIYGEKIYEEKPFVARLKNQGVWIVEGTLKNGVGGVAYIEIQKKDCKILKVSHGK